MESPYKEIVTGIVGGGVFGGVIAFIKGIVEIYKILAERIEAKRKEKKANLEQHLSNSVEMRRLEQVAEDATYERICQMLKISQDEEERLRGELREARKSSTLSDSRVTQMYSSFRALGKTIATLDWLIAKKEGCDDLALPLENLKKSYDALGEKMP